MSKHSQSSLVRLLENAIRDVGDIDSKKLYVLVRHVETKGSPPESLDVDVLVRFLAAGSPFCCGEPLCHSRAFGSAGGVEMGEYVARKMNLDQEVSVRLKVDVEYSDGVKFKTGGLSGGAAH